MEGSATYIHGTHAEEQKRLSLLNQITNNSFIDFLSINRNDSILEVGSGLGILANEIAVRFPGTTVTGIEISTEQIDKARNNFGSTENLKFIQGNALSLDFDDSSCDLVYCRYVLEHVSDPLTVLREILRVLKDGGRFFVQENNVLINELYPDCPDFNYVLKKSIALQSRLGGDAEIGKKLFYLLKQAGFSSIELSICPEVHHFDSPAFDSWLINTVEILKSEKDMLIEMEKVSANQIESAINELNELRQNPYASSYFYWNRASAIKQDNASRP